MSFQEATHFLRVRIAYGTVYFENRYLCAVLLDGSLAGIEQLRVELHVELRLQNHLRDLQTTAMYADLVYHNTWKKCFGSFFIETFSK